MQNEYVKLIVIGSERYAVDFTIRNHALLVHLIVIMQSCGRSECTHKHTEQRTVNTCIALRMPLNRCEIHNAQNQRMLRKTSSYVPSAFWLRVDRF